MRNRLAVVLGIVTAVLAVSVTAQTNVTGRWTVTSSTEQGENPPSTMTLQQDGEKVTGSIDTEQGTVEFEGMLSGDKIEFVLEVDAGGMVMEITLTGTVDGDQMTGTLDLGGYGGGDWAATRIP